jgi:hypothetical protein
MKAQLLQMTTPDGPFTILASGRVRWSRSPGWGTSRPPSKPSMPVTRRQ